MKPNSALPNKFKLTDEAHHRLKWIKSKTSLEEWTIARLGLCFSLGDSHCSDLKKHLGAGGEGVKEFNRYTLTGEFDLFYCELVRSYWAKYLAGEMSEGDSFRAHLNRGIVGISRQIKSLPDMVELVAARS